VFHSHAIQPHHVRDVVFIDVLVEAMPDEFDIIFAFKPLDVITPEDAGVNGDVILWCKSFV
jgi:hypothetical protein